MAVITLQTMIRFCVAASAAMVPLAHLKLSIFGMPFYSTEIPVVGAILVYVYGLRRKEFFPLVRAGIHRKFIFGALVFLCGAIISFVVNPFSLTGLGMIKSWFVVPMIAAWLWLETDPSEHDTAQLLLVWFGSTVVVACANLAFFVVGNLTYDNRLAGWYLSPNYLAFFLAPGMLLGGFFFLRCSLGWMRRFGALLGTVVLGGALFFTHSYGAWGAVLVAWGAFLALGKTFRGYGKVCIVGTLLFAFFTLIVFEAGSAKWQSLMTFDERSSLASRAMIWKATARIIADSPIFGIGIGRFQEVYLAYQKYFPPYLEWAVPQPHNLYLAVWAQTGIMGLFGFFLMLVAWFRKARDFFRSVSVREENRGTTALVVAIMILYSVLGLVDTPFFKTDLAFTGWLTFALGLALFECRKTS